MFLSDLAFCADPRLNSATECQEGH